MHLAVRCFCLFSACLLAEAASPVRAVASVTVLIDFENPHSETSLAAMRQSLDGILGPAGIVVDVQLKSELAPFAQFGDLVIFKMKGSCTMNAEPLPRGALLDERGPLAMAYASDGEVLHFGEVECDRIRYSLGRILGRDVCSRNQMVLGRAMAMVMAHEIYHMMGNAKEHTRKGVTKTSLSAAELLDGTLKLPAEALEALEKSAKRSEFRSQP